MLKKTIGFILSFFLCLSISGIQLNAQENVIQISTADELVKFADEVNQGNYSGNTDIIVNLETDIDLNGMEWTPIGIDRDHSFSGTFNGNGHTISNFKITVGSYQYTGFFGISDCDIMNLNLSGIISSDSFLNGSGADMAGSFAGYLIGDAQVSFISEDNTKYSVENHQVSLPVGQYTVLIEKENYHSIREQVTITYDISTHTLNYELVLLDADYRKVEDAVAKANALDSELYKDFSGVEKAIAGVVYDLDITHQGEVNAMAKAIEDAINALEYKDADYTAVNDVIAKAEALNPEDYVDFTHVSDAIDAVVENLNITHQKEVDDMAQAILDAISELEEKPAETPSTSDNSYITCWMMIMIGAAMSLIGFVVYDYKKKLTH